jgi:hypothetical protein
MMALRVIHQSKRLNRRFVQRKPFMTREHQVSRPSSTWQGRATLQRCCWLCVAVVGCATETTDHPAGDDESSSRGGSSSVGGSKSGGTSGLGGTKPVGGGGTSAGGAAGVTAGGASAGSTAGGSKTAGTSGTGGSGGNASAGGGTGGSSSGAGGKTSGGTGGSGGAGGGGNGGSGSAMCDDGVAFCDDFEDQNANGWTKSGGTWSVVQDAADWVYAGGNGSEEAYAGDATWTDQTIEANVKVVSFGGTSDSYRAGIMARHTGSSSFYVFALGGDGKLTLRKSTSAPSGSTGTCAALAAGVDTNAWLTLKMSVTGNAGSVRIQTYINGQPRHDCTTTSSPLAQGRVGVLTYGSGTVAHFDDVSVTTP